MKGRFKMRVMGIKQATFKNKDTGEIISYCQLHVADNDKNVVGEAVEILKIPGHLVDEVIALKPGDKIQATYNKFGKVDAVRKLA
ncbi:MAG: hypothetical protein QXR45_16085 [Candidatus Bathyarchaeia archaeon]